MNPDSSLIAAKKKKKSEQVFNLSGPLVDLFNQDPFPPSF